MKSRYSYRIYPTSQQKRALAQLFGCVRIVYNDSLALAKMSRKLPKVSELQKVFITLSKKTPSRKWLSEVSAIPLQQSIADLGTAYTNFFSGLKSGKRVGYPRFKKRSNQQSARFTRGGFSIKRGKVYLAKIGLLTTKWSRSLPSSPSSVTVIKDCANRYFISFVVERACTHLIEAISKPAPRESIGVDLGIKIFAALSNGEKVYAPLYQSLERKIGRAQRRLAKLSAGSNRREKLRLEIARLHARLADKRKDFLHKLSTRLVKGWEVISLENLNVSGMVKNRRLAKAISRCGWSEFRTMCKNKATLYGRSVQIIDRWQPTSQVCSLCGYKWGKLDLKIREVVCLGCGQTHCRDVNAAKNIDNVGAGLAHDNKRTVSDSKSSKASCSETSTREVEWEQLSLFNL